MNLIKHSLIVLTALSFFILIRCGSNIEADGDNAYAKGNYNQALTYYLKVKKTQPQNARIDEKIALTYMQRGYKFYKLRNNLDAFQLNYEKSLEFIPGDSLSANFRKEYSKLLYRLAMAYHGAKPLNEIQKEKYFNLTFDFLEKALQYDSTKTEADAKLSEIRAANFQKYFERGKDFYKRALKDPRNTNLFLSAEAYLLQAVRLDPLNREALKLLKKVRQKTISILEIRNDLPLALAVGGRKYKSGNLVLSITIFNNTIDPFTVDPNRFHLVDKQGNRYGVNLDLTAEYSKGLTEPQTIGVKSDHDWVLVFTIPNTIPVEKLAYETENGVVISKYFP